MVLLSEIVSSAGISIIIFPNLRHPGRHYVILSSCRAWRYRWHLICGALEHRNQRYLMVSSTAFCGGWLSVVERAENFVTDRYLFLLYHILAGRRLWLILLNFADLLQLFLGIQMMISFSLA